MFPARRMHPGATPGLIVSLWLVSAMPCPVRSEAPRVLVEELVTRCRPADNGAGPLWCYGSSLIVPRSGATDEVYVSAIETGEDVPPPCNTRWKLWRRDFDGWSVVAREIGFRQREPCPIALIRDGAIFLSVNPSTEPPGTRYGACRPLVLRFSPGAPLHAVLPEWARRGFPADPDNRHLRQRRKRRRAALRPH